MNVLVPQRGFAFYGTQHDAMLEDLRSAKNIRIKEISIHALRTKTDLLGAVAKALDFPPLYLSHINYDSFEEAVRDLSWLAFDNIAIVLSGCSRQWATNYLVMAALLEILTDAHRFWDDKGKGFFVAFVE